MKRLSVTAAIAVSTLAVLAACKQTADPAEPAPAEVAGAAQSLTSADGTKVAYERVGSGPALIVVGGMLSDRKAGEGLAKALSSDFTVYTFDRRGRGDTVETAPYSVEREIEDIAALQKLAGDAVLYGSSSGAGLALAAAASGIPVRALILHEPPFGSSDEQSRKKSADAAAKARQLIASDRPKEAVESYLTYTGAPPAMAQKTASNPDTLRMAPSMLHDLDVMDSDNGSLLPEQRVRAVSAKTVVLIGSKAPKPFFDAGNRIVELAQGGRLEVLEGQEHIADPAVVAAAIREALRPQ